MNRIVKFAASLLVFAGAMVSCQKETLVEPGSAVPTSFTAAFEQTKVTIDGLTPKFEVGDELTVEGSNNAKATFAVSEVSAAGAKFEIKGSWSATPSAPYRIYNGTPTMSNVAMVAYSAPNTISNAEAMSLDQAIVLAQANELKNVELKNMCSVIKLVLPKEVKSIKVAPVSGTLWDGAAIMFQTFTASQFPSASAKEITYTGAEQSLPAGTYYIPFFPQTFTGGVMVGYTIDGTEYFWRQKDGNFIFQRNKLYDMGSLADWPQPQPKYSVEDLVGDYTGSLVFGNQQGETFQGSSYPDAEFAIAASDNESKGNVKFTKFLNTECGFYATFDLFVGTVTIAANESIKYDKGSNLSVVLTNPVVLNFSEDKTQLSLPAHTVFGPHQYLSGFGYNVAADPFTLTKKTAPDPGPTGPTVADFVGTYKGGLVEQTYMSGAPMGPAQDRTDASAHQEFEFTAEENGANNVVMTKYFGNVCNVPGFFDTETLQATFAAGASLTFVQGSGATSTPLVLQLSADYKTLTQVGKLTANANPPFPFVYEVSQISLTKQGGAAGAFELSDIVTPCEWAVTYKANGVAKVENSGDNTKFKPQEAHAAEATGCNLLISYFMCGYNSAYANFDLATGTLTIPQARNSGVLYFPAIDWTAKYLNSDVVMQMSADKKTIVATGSFQLKDGTTISDYTFTRQ